METSFVMDYVQEWVYCPGRQWLLLLHELLCGVFITLLRSLQSLRHHVYSKTLRPKLCESHCIDLLLRSVACKLQLESPKRWQDLGNDELTRRVHFPKRVGLQLICMVRHRFSPKLDYSLRSNKWRISCWHPKTHHQRLWQSKQSPRNQLLR
jgi:hypothetical protein